MGLDWDGLGWRFCWARMVIWLGWILGVVENLAGLDIWLGWRFGRGED